MNDEKIIEESLREAFRQGSWNGMPLEKCWRRIKEAMNLALDKQREEITKIVKSFPVGRFIGFKCTNHEDFEPFINNWTRDMIQKINQTKQEEKPNGKTN